MSVDSWIGERGYWIDDNEYCEVIGVIDKGAGLYEFKGIDSPEDGWVGFIDDFSPEE